MVYQSQKTFSYVLAPKYVPKFDYDNLQQLIIVYKNFTYLKWFCLGYLNHLQCRSECISNCYDSLYHTIVSLTGTRKTIRRTGKHHPVPNNLSWLRDENGNIMNSHLHLPHLDGFHYVRHSTNDMNGIITTWHCSLATRAIITLIDPSGTVVWLRNDYQEIFHQRDLSAPLSSTKLPGRW